jgi:hypothetical protein
MFNKYSKYHKITNQKDEIGQENGFLGKEELVMLEISAV